MNIHSVISQLSRVLGSKPARIAVLGLTILPGLAAAGTLATGSSGENWKGSPDPGRLRVSAMGGLSIVDGATGFGLIGAASIKLINKGFASDLNNQVFLEFEAGPLFYAGITGALFGLNLRWDFQKDEDWVFYGFGGPTIVSRGTTPSSMEFFPRFGVGGWLNLASGVGVRVELSHELMMAGATFAF